MYLISKIIAKEWLRSLIGAIVVLFLLITVGDIINGFLRGYEAKRVLFEYLLKLPELASKMLPISALLASLFSINKLKAHSELMAILAGGFSVRKIYILFFSCSLFIGVFQLVNLGYLIPAANKVKREEFEKSKKNESKYLARSTIGKSGLIWYKSANYFTSFKAFDSKNKLLKEVTIYFLDKDKKLDSVYKAQSAQFITTNQWTLNEVVITQNINKKVFPKITSSNHLIINLKETPADFKQFESDITTLNLGQLGDFITRLKDTGINSTEYEIMFYEKFSLALVCIVFSLFPVAGIFTPNRRSSGFGQSVVFTLLFSIGFWLIHSGGIALGNSGKIPPFLATMGIPIFFSLYIIWSYRKNRELS